MSMTPRMLQQRGGGARRPSAGPRWQEFEAFRRGMNQVDARTAIADDEAYWLENMIPIGAGALQGLNGRGDDERRDGEQRRSERRRLHDLARHHDPDPLLARLRFLGRHDVHRDLDDANRRRARGGAGARLAHQRAHDHLHGAEHVQRLHGRERRGLDDPDGRGVRRERRRGGLGPRADLARRQRLRGGAVECLLLRDCAERGHGVRPDEHRPDDRHDLAAVAPRVLPRAHVPRALRGLRALRGDAAAALGEARRPVPVPDDRRYRVRVRGDRQEPPLPDLPGPGHGGVAGERGRADLPAPRVQQGPLLPGLSGRGDLGHDADRRGRGAGVGHGRHHDLSHVRRGGYGGRDGEDGVQAPQLRLLDERQVRDARRRRGRVLAAAQPDADDRLALQERGGHAHDHGRADVADDGGRDHHVHQRGRAGPRVADAGADRLARPERDVRHLHRLDLSSHRAAASGAEVRARSGAGSRDGDEAEMRRWGFAALLVIGILTLLLRPPALLGQSGGPFIRATCSQINSPTTGESVCFNSTRGEWQVWTGSAWVSISGASNSVTNGVLFATATGTTTNANFTFTGTALTLAGGQLLLPDGTAAAPSLTFMNETNTGWFRNGAGDIQVVLGGAQWIRLLSGLGVVFNQTLGFASDNANNIGSVGANRPANIYAATAVSAPKFTTTGTGTYAFTLGNTETVGSLNTRVTFKTPGAGVHAFHFANTAFTATSSFSDVLYTDPLIQPGSGSGSFAALQLNPTINGTSTGIAYGLGIASLTNVLTGGTIKPFSVGTTTTNLFTGYTPLIEIDITGYIEGKEQTAPAAPAANGYRLFAQDNGAGKTQLMVIFGSGVAQQIAIEP